MKNYSILLENTNSLLQRQIKLKLIIALVVAWTLVSMSIGYLISSLTKHPNQIEKLVYSEKFITAKYNEEFSPKALRKLLEKLHVKNIDIIMAQSKIETSHYSSQVYLENNNLFGMRQAKNRITTATGSNLGHATYDSWQESAIDLALYQTAYLRNKTDKEYLNYLGANYATNKEYVTLINKMIK